MIFFSFFPYVLASNYYDFNIVQSGYMEKEGRVRHFAATQNIMYKNNLTEGSMALVEYVVNRTGETDPDILIDRVCEELMDRYQNDTLEYHLSQMHLETTNEVKRTICCYLISRKIFPEKSYIRKSKFVECVA